MPPRISVIISTYNAELFIRGRLENLVNQTIFSETEVIVVNSGSQQNEEHIVRDFQKQYSNIIYLSTHQRETIYKAWNRGIAIAHGKYIANANTDDRSRKDALEIFAQTLDMYPKVGMVYADQYVTSMPNASYENSIRGKRNFRYPFSRLRLLAGYYLGSQQMWRASLHFQDEIWFDEQYEVTGDYDFACRVAELYDLLLVEDVLGIYYLSKTKSNKQYQNMDRFLCEDTKVREKYLQRYLVELSTEQLNRLYKTTRFWVAIPKLVYPIMHRIMDVVDPRSQIANRIFWCWLGSHLEEQRGKIEAAKSCCRKCLNIPSANVIHRRYHDLLEKYQ